MSYLLNILVSLAYNMIVDGSKEYPVSGLRI
jgi:hypothetical protein